uniref:Ig-like domain-containing protein n=1 Tax=Scleropages formosus TaxID=113540 RepID=A0A8C9W9T2_SCLFO
MCSKCPGECIRWSGSPDVGGWEERESVCCITLFPSQKPCCQLPVCGIIQFIHLANAFLHTKNLIKMYLECHFTSGDLKDLEFIDRYVFNKDEYIRYNSTLKKFIGFTEHGVRNAERWNQDGFSDQAYGNLDGYYCPKIAFFDYGFEPLVKVKSVKSGSQRHSTMLVCSAYNFYPEGIKLTWLRDGKEVKTDVTSTEELYDGDWYYQIHSYLELTPTSGETTACKVEHSSFSEPKVFKWDPSTLDGERNKVIIGASGLVLGLILSLAGVIYYKKKSTGRILVPTS